MKQNDLIKLLREYLHDPEGKVWSDTELVELLERAARDYSFDTQSFRTVYRPLVAADGRIKFPPAFAAVLAAWNDNHLPVDPANSGDAADAFGDFRNTAGDAQILYEDLDTFGVARLCPNPARKQAVRRFAPADPYGVIVRNGYGTWRPASGYGIPLAGAAYHAVIEIVYVRLAPPEEIDDYLALIAHAAAGAYSADSDFQNPDRAALYRGEYRRRTARANAARTAGAPHRTNAKFF